MRVTACSGANWEEYENLDHRRLGFSGRGELARRFISIHSSRCVYQSHSFPMTTIKHDWDSAVSISPHSSRAFFFSPKSSFFFFLSNIMAWLTFDRCYYFKSCLNSGPNSCNRSSILTKKMELQSSFICSIFPGASAKESFTKHPKS